MSKRDIVYSSCNLVQLSKMVVLNVVTLVFGCLFDVFL